MGWGNDPVIGGTESGFGKDPVIDDAPAAKGPASRRKGKAPASPRNLGGFGTGLRDQMVAAASTVGVLTDPIAAFGNEATEALGYGRPFATASGLAEAAADRLGLARATTPTGRVVSGINRAVGGTLMTAGAGMTSTVAKVAPRAAAFLADSPLMQAISAASGATTGGLVAEETDNPLAIGAATMAGSFIPGVVSGTVAASRNRRDSTAVNLLLADRDNTAAVTDLDVQQSVRGDYERTMQPFEAEYSNLDNLDRPTYTPDPVQNPVEWGMPVQQPPRQVPASTANWRNVLTEEANGIVTEGIEGTLTTLNRIDTSTLSGMKDARSHLLSEARSATAPNKARVLRRMAEAVQDDIDETLLSTTARELSARYRRDVVGPYDRVRKSGALQPGTDASESWKAIRNAGREDLERLARAASPETVALIRRRTVGDIIARENQFQNPLQGGSGFPVWRTLDEKGMGAFFTPEEWRGLRRLAGAQAALKNPIIRGAMATTGAITGGLDTLAWVAFGEWASTTREGRLFLSRAGGMGRNALAASLRNTLANPGTMQAEIQVAKDREAEGQQP